MGPSPIPGKASDVVEAGMRSANEPGATRAAFSASTSQKASLTIRSPSGNLLGMTSYFERADRPLSMRERQERVRRALARAQGSRDDGGEEREFVERERGKVGVDGGREMVGRVEGEKGGRSSRLGFERKEQGFVGGSSRRIWWRKLRCRC